MKSKYVFECKLNDVSLFFYEMNTDNATINRPTFIIERNRIVWLEERTGKLTSTVNCVQKDGCHVFRGEKDPEHILLKCSETKKRRK